jgi:hypothetical protein
MKWHRFAVFIGASLLVVLIAQATTLNFKSGAIFEGDIVEVKGTNVLVRSDKDGRQYAIPLAYLTEADQTRITSKMSDEYFAGYRAEQQREKEPVPDQPENKADEGKIVGAFGLKLGQQFDLKYAISTNKTSEYVEVNGETLWMNMTGYAFRPKVFMTHFSRYSVDVTPRSNFVYSISATALDLHLDDSTFNALEEGQKLLSVLEQKYGKATIIESDDKHCSSHRITQATREVTLTYGFSTNEDYVIIRYEDSVLCRQARREQFEIDAANPARKAERDRLKQQL